MKYKIVFILPALLYFPLEAQILPGFKPSGLFNEQQLYIEISPPGTRILINAPLDGFNKKSSLLLIFYSLPNGNTIEQTSGKNLKDGDDWHYNIQHIAAQTRFLRNTIKNQTIVVVYLQAIYLIYCGIQ
jgi:hypothetical protein